MFEYVNEIAVLVASLLSVAVGYIWYSPIVFGPVWMRALGRSTDDELLTAVEMCFAVCKSVAAFFVFFYVLARTTYVLDVVFSTVAIGALGLVGSHMLWVSVWEKRNMSYFFVHIGYSALIIFGGLAIITFWPW